MLMSYLLYTLDTFGITFSVFHIYQGKEESCNPIEIGCNPVYCLSSTKTLPPYFPKGKGVFISYF